ncbi:MAG: L,D-transpeptidase/peptidoglycan binding protein [Candidatus Berkelbacteria bacterium]|nr:L,D-transpeptidase/peptidoglycan binding protein [Candidatus Berkelbacteria bacterium]
MAEEIKKAKIVETIKNTAKRFRFGKYFLAAFLCLLGVLILFYGGFAYAYKDKSLPFIKVDGEDLGGLNKGQIISKLQEIFIEKNNQKIEIEFEGEKISKSYIELGVTIDYVQSPGKILNFGKLAGIFPSPAYLRQTTDKEIYALPVKLWIKAPEKTFLELFPSKKADPENPKLKLENDEVKIEDEKAGYAINYTRLKNGIEGCFLLGCSGKLYGEKYPTKSNIVTSDLVPFLDAIKEVSRSRILLSYSYRRTYLERENILELIDVERTVLNQKLTFGDQSIEDYLKELSKKINQRARPKQISTYDGSLVSEGREGLKVDEKKSKEILVNALNNKETKATLEVTTSEIETEYVAPGFTPGKYPGRYIEINLSEQMLYQFEGSNMVGSHKVSTGKWSMPTPIGEYAINNKDPRAYSQKYGLYMPYWMSFIGSDYGIHELPEWPSGAKEGESHLGTPVSHGCVRLGRGSAETVYNWADIGTPVYIHR